MRILSQDGLVDMPYEQMIVNIDYTNKNKIVACGVSCDGENSMFHIADYSTEAKARKAMEMLREAYCGNLYIYVDQFVLMAQHYASRPELLKLLNEAVEHVKYFRFPSDDEVEV